ncbi:hypothetical protein PENTCL1PPCAC_23772, partial [Pristionchus entomophagus]
MQGLNLNRISQNRSVIDHLLEQCSLDCVREVLELARVLKLLHILSRLQLIETVNLNNEETESTGEYQLRSHRELGGSYEKLLTLADNPLDIELISQLQKIVHVLTCNLLGRWIDQMKQLDEFL